MKLRVSSFPTKYDHLSKTNDISNKGFIGGDAINLMRRSKLEDVELGKLWALSGRGNKGELDMEEFAIAMHRIYEKVNEQTSIRRENELAKSIENTHGRLRILERRVRKGKKKDGKLVAKEGSKEEKLNLQLSTPFKKRPKSMRDSSFYS